MESGKMAAKNGERRMTEEEARKERALEFRKRWFAKVEEWKKLLETETQERVRARLERLIAKRMAATDEELAKRAENSEGYRRQLEEYERTGKVPERSDEKTAGKPKSRNTVEQVEEMLKGLKPKKSEES